MTLNGMSDAAYFKTTDYPPFGKRKCLVVPSLLCSRCVIDKNAKRFQRANFFKVYMTNPSIRCALFSPITSEDSAIGSLVETAIFSQWFHSDKADLYYSRWKNGEVDIVSLGTQQNIDWAVEVKWSDRILTHISEMKNMIQFCHTNNLNEISVTTKTKYGHNITENVSMEFIPASIYCYTVGYNLIKGKSIGKTDG